jgi:hypothetical protein
MTMTAEAEAARPSGEPSPSLVARLFGVLLSPRSTFGAIVTRPRPFGALVVVCLCAAIASGWLYGTELGQQMILVQQVEGMESFGVTVTDEMYAQMERGLENAAYLSAAGPVVALPIITFIIAGLVWTACYVILGAHAPFKAMYAVVTHIGAVSIVQLLFTIPLNYARGVMGSPATLAALLPMLDEASFAGRTLGLVEFFVVWQLFLLAVGAGVLYKRRTGPIAATFYSLYAVIAVAAGLVMSRLGG